MRIVELRCDAYKWEVPDAHWISDIPRMKMPAVGYIVRVISDEGIEGNCTIPGLIIGVLESIERLRPLVVGQNPLERERIWHTMMRVERLWGYHMAVVGAIDVALWDLAGKQCGLPVYQLLGGYRNQVLAYATSPMRQSAQEYIDEAVECKARGYRGYKVHPLGEPERDIEVCRGLREAVGPDMALMLDACGAYNHESALKVGRVLEPLDFFWFQNPLPDHDIEGFAHLSSILDVPIAGTERFPGSCNITGEYIRRRAVDIIRSDVRIKGGITAVKKMAVLAEAFGINIEIHATLSPLMNVANLHVLCSIKNGYFHEIVQPEDQHLYAVEPWEHIDDAGYIHVPEKPGLGLEIDWDYIRKHPV